ncbi:MAG: Tryptophan 2,3-dioxygenase [Candidatus Heimdallarchaeota archaeon LC_2]|nr:MAG: Tryptophan 2,3-dioxygenase [Candidatus Heimdallarchaeota archaeon LC_2]
MDQTVIYWDYLNIPKLLQLQGGVENDEDAISEDEMSFIIIHQVFELWFKLILKEIKLATKKMSQESVEEDVIPLVVHHIDRINVILRSAVKHFDLMETLIPQDFLMFREKLGTASGFQSFQMREMELLLGLELTQRKAQGHDDPIKYILDTAVNSEAGKDILDRISNAKESLSLRDAIHKWLYRTPIQGSSPNEENDEDIVNSFIQNYLDNVKEMFDNQISNFSNNDDIDAIRNRFDISLKQSTDFLFANDVTEVEKFRMRRVRTAILFIESYRELPLLSWPRKLIDTIVELEEQMVIFRFRHARMVERIIGRKVGTGGSAGVDYLDETTKYRVFPELSTIRTMLLPKFTLPELKKPEFYQFSRKN